MELVLEISGDQIDGARDYQEDAFLVSFLDDEEGGSRSSSLVIMADGMGGHAAGNIASNLVVSTFNKSFTGGFGREEAPQLLRRSLEKANEALSESIKETPALDGMGCTMVTGLFTRGRGYWISVGDSHLYLFRDNLLEKKNEDHSYGGYLDRMRAQGMEVEEEPGLSRNMLMSAMTGDPIAEVDCPSTAFELRAGDRIVVCSDGLDTLSEAAISQTCGWAGSAKECVAALLKAVEEARKPRQDNTTVIVVDVHSGENGVKAAPPSSDLSVQGDDDDTAQLSFEELESALKDAPPPPAMREADLLPPPRPPKSNTGLIVGIVAALVLAGAAAAYFLFLQPGASPEQPGGARTGEASGGEASGGEVAQGGESTSESSAGSTQTQGEPSGGSQGEETTQGSEGTSTEEDPLNAALNAVDKEGSTDSPTDSESTANEPGERVADFEEITDPLQAGGNGPRMVALPGGTFRMGSVGGNRAEHPLHDVTVKPFAIGKFEVSIAEYRVFASATGRRVNTNDLIGESAPVVNVSWDDALAYARWLSVQTGVRYRLPSEAEWEYAARGGKRSAYWWGQNPGEGRAHCFDCKSGFDRESPVRVNSFEPNPFGLHNVSGNAAEWVYDCYHGDYRGAPTDGSVWEGGDCSKRMVRGGSFRTTSGSIRVGARDRVTSSRRSDEVGFRVARDLE